MAPMADVTDAAFRRIFAKYGKPDVTWTEFVSADGLFLGGYDKLIKDLEFSEAERPIVAQFFTANPELMEKAAALAVKLGFDGVDINMGCPDKGVERQGAGAGLIKNPTLAKEIIRAAKRGAGALPVSVKTRIGYNKNELATWLPALLEEEPAVVTIHARTRKEMSKVPARWEHVREAVEIRNKLQSQTLIFGNGDVKDLDDAYAKAKETGADGVMLGRAIFGNPFLFSKKKRPELDEGRGEWRGKRSDLKSEERSDLGERRLEERLNVMLEHTKLFEELLGEHKNFSVMKKHYKAYVNGFSGAGELRAKLMETESAKEVVAIVEDFLKKPIQ